MWNALPNYPQMGFLAYSAPSFVTYRRPEALRCLHSAPHNQPEPFEASSSDVVGCASEPQLGGSVGVGTRRGAHRKNHPSSRAPFSRSRQHSEATIAAAAHRLHASTTSPSSLCLPRHVIARSSRTLTDKLPIPPTASSACTIHHDGRRSSSPSGSRSTT